MKTFTVVVEGNVASGKTTLMKTMMDTVPEFTVFIEPVDRWNYVPMETQLSHLKQKYLDDPVNYAVPYQLEAYSIFADFHRTIVPTAIKVMERSIHSSQIFQQVMLEEGKLTAEKYSFLQESRKYWCTPEDFQPDLVIYLQTPPEVCISRLKAVKPIPEFPIECITKLHYVHEEFISGLRQPVSRISGDDSPSNIFRSAVTAIFTSYCANRLTAYANHSSSYFFNESHHGATAAGQELAAAAMSGQTP